MESFNKSDQNKSSKILKDTKKEHSSDLRKEENQEYESMIYLNL